MVKNAENMVDSVFFGQNNTVQKIVQKQLCERFGMVI